MKKILHKIGKCGRCLAFLLAFAMILAMGNGAQAADTAGEAYDGNEKGSIHVELADTGGSWENVEVRLYQVGTLDVSKGYLWFELMDDLKEKDTEGVDLNNIITGDANTAAAEALLTALEEIGTEPVSQWTDENGETTFAGLEQGMYLIAEGSANAYGEFSPLLVPVPLADETHWDYNPTVQPKADGETGLFGRIEVTKKLKGTNADGNLQDVGAENATYYVGLFMDPAGEHPYSGGQYFQPVHIIGGSSGTISFDRIPIIDDPYYIFETDENGNPLTYLDPQENGGFYCMAGEVYGAEGYGAAPSIILANETTSLGSAVISNVYGGDLPDGYYYTGEITISKSVKDGDQIMASGDTFYAGIFVVDAQGNVAANPTDVVKLNNNGVVTVEVPLGGTDGTEPVTYAVMETDENGKLIDKPSFDYTVTGEGNVNLSMNQTKGSVDIVNTLGNSEGYYQEPSTQAPTDPNAGNNNNNNSTDRNSSNRNTSSGTNRSSRSSRTGDDNQILLYGGLLAAAVIVGGVVVARRRRRTNG